MPGAAGSLTYWHVLELEALFEDHGVWSGVTTDSPALEWPNEQGALAQPLPCALQLADRQKGAHFSSALVVAYAFPPHTSGFTLENLDLTHVWSGGDSDVVEPRSLTKHVH